MQLPTIESLFGHIFLWTGTLGARCLDESHYIIRTMQKIAIVLSLLSIAVASTSHAGGLESPIAEPLVEEPVAVAPVGSFVGGSVGGAAVVGGVLGLAIVAALIGGGDDDGATSTTATGGGS